MKFKTLCLALSTACIWYGCTSPSDNTNKQEQSPTVENQATPQPADSTAAAPPATADQEPNSTVKLIQLTMQDLNKDDLAKGFIDSGSRVFKYSEFDLNNDGKKEIFVGLTGSNWCGSGGCTMYLLDNQGNVISRFTTVDYPVIVNESMTKGWRDLIINSGGNRTIKHNGTKYPTNLSAAPKFTGTPGDGLPRMLVWENTPSYSF